MVSGYAAALPACFTAKTQRKRGLLRPRQTNRASYAARKALPARFNTINTRQCIALFVTLGCRPRKSNASCRARGLPAYFPPAPQSCKDRASQTQWPNGPAVARATPTAAFALALAGCPSGFAMGAYAGCNPVVCFLHCQRVLPLRRKGSAACSVRDRSTALLTLPGTHCQDGLTRLGTSLPSQGA